MDVFTFEMDDTKLIQFVGIPRQEVTDIMEQNQEYFGSIKREIPQEESEIVIRKWQGDERYETFEQRYNNVLEQCDNSNVRYISKFYKVAV